SFSPAGPSHQPHVPAQAAPQPPASNPATAFAQMHQNPGQFMQTEPVRIHGAPSGVANYHFEQSPSGKGFNLRPTTQPNAGGVQPGAGFQAHSVGMHQPANGNQLGQIPFYNLPSNGPNTMVTPQLSGCSLVMRPGAQGGLDVAHVRPPQGMTGEQVA